MTDWTSGYVADVDYTFGYYTELNPMRIKLAFLHNGLVYPEVATACELGFGQGLSVNIHAAASKSKWYGTDFNPSQAGFARELAGASLAGAELFDQAFDEFCSREDLPMFDFIGLHGIWSWISDQNRNVITNFLHKKLKVGGVLYISYNTQPGWASMVPLRDLMVGHADVLGAKGRGTVSRIDSAIEFVERLFATNPTYIKANPQLSERIKSIKQQNRNYLAHEYFNKDWEPMSFAKVNEWLTSAKLDFACSANYIDQIDTVNLSAEQQTLLSEITDSKFKQTTRDFMVNQQFRRDYWVKGPRRLSAVAQLERVRQEKVVLVVPRNRITLKISGALGEATMSDKIYTPVLDFLADHKSRTIGEIEEAVYADNVTFSQILQAIMILSGKGDIASVQDKDVIHSAQKSSKQLNSHLVNLSRFGGEVSYLSSPVTGGGISVTRFEQLFLLAMQKGVNNPEGLSRFAWKVLSQQSQKIVKDGRALESEEENLHELFAQASDFYKFKEPILRSAGII